MAVSYVRYSLDAISDLAGSASADGSLSESTTYYFVVLALYSTAINTVYTAISAPSNIASVSTDATNKTIDLSWTAVPGATRYMVYWTKVDPGSDPTALNFTGWMIKDSANTHYASTAATSFTFDSERLSGSPYYSVSYGDAYRFVAIFNEKIDYFRISGSTVDDPASFESLYQACLANSWDSVEKFHDRTYFVKANVTLVTASSYFVSQAELVYMTGGFYNAASGAMTVLGTGTSDTDPAEGAVWVSLAGQASAWWSGFNFHDLRAFNWSFKNIRQGYQYSPTDAYISIVLSGDDFQIANCNMERIQYLSFLGGALSTSFCKDVVVTRGRWAYYFGSDVSAASFDNVYSINSGMASYMRYSPIVSGLNTKGTAQYEILAINSVEDLQAICIDSNIDFSKSSVIQWFQSGRLPTGNEYIKVRYSLALTVQNKAGLALVGASVSITDLSGATSFTGDTDSNGQINTVLDGGVHKSKYLVANNTGTYTSYSPHTLTITAPGYQTKTVVLSMDRKREEVVTLEPIVPLIHTADTNRLIVNAHPSRADNADEWVEVE